jgi:hypothetical protein
MQRPLNDWVIWMASDLVIQNRSGLSGLYYEIFDYQQAAVVFVPELL